MWHWTLGSREPMNGTSNSECLLEQPCMLGRIQTLLERRSTAKRLGSLSMDTVAAAMPWEVSLSAASHLTPMERCGGSRPRSFSIVIQKGLRCLVSCDLTSPDETSRVLRDAPLAPF